MRHYISSGREARYYHNLAEDTHTSYSLGYVIAYGLVSLLRLLFSALIGLCKIIKLF